MIERIVRFCLKSPAVAILFALFLVAIGSFSYSELNIEAYPNPVPPLVEIIAQPPGWSAEETERYVTIPLEVGLSGMPGLDHTRSQSLFGLADVKCYFKWGTKFEDARQEVINRLQFVNMPDGVTPTISPWNAIGEVYRYTVEGKGYSVRELKTAEDWILERQFKQVPGVVDVVSFGGETKQFQVGVDPYRLRGHAVTLQQVITAVQNANVNSGGQRLEMGEQSYDIRGIGLLTGTRDIDDIVIVDVKGTPVRVRDVADVKIGPAPRLGLIGIDDRPDVVQGTVLMRYGAETKPTLEGIHARLDYIRANHLLPPGMEVKPYYDRGDLVALTTHTVMENVVVGIALVSIVLLMFLGHVRAALITSITIPLALLGAFTGIVFTKQSANLISIGAVDFGIVVDSSVIMMENIFRHLGSHGRGSMRQRVRAAAHEVGTPMTFSTLIIGSSFIPLFTMTGVSGVIFSPMARTYAFAIGTAILLALTLLPVLAWKLIPATSEEKDPLVMRAMHRIYTPVADAFLKFPKLAIPLRIVVIAICAVLFPLLGGEFMPKLEEGNLWIRATLPKSISLTESTKYVGAMRRIIRGCNRTDEDRVRRPQTREAPRGHLGHFAARSSGRRHRRHRLLQHRALRAAEAVRRVEERPDEGSTHRSDGGGAPPGVPRRRLQLLADDRRQRARGGRRRQRRELDQGLRPRSRREREKRRPHRRHARPGSRHRRPRQADDARSAERQDLTRPPSVLALRPQLRRRRRCRPDRDRRSGRDAALRA